jgi:hypothetical protein
MNRYEIELHISPERYLEYYRGTVQHVVARCTTGQTVRFPASLLQRFVSHEGIHGRFVLSCDDEHKGAELQRMDSAS